MRPHVHAAWQTRSVMRLFVLASLPAAVLGTGNLGWQTLLAIEAGRVESVPAWLGELAAMAETSAMGGRLLVAAAMGLGVVLPLLVVTLGAAGFWAAVFARARNRPVDVGWLPGAWLLVLLLPPATTPAVAALAASFAAVVGLHIFGGTGRQLVSPALLGVLFVHFSYPELATSVLPVPAPVITDWAMAVGSGGAQPGTMPALIGIVPGAIGTTSTLACLFGAALLVAVRVASWRVLAGAGVGLLVSWAVLRGLADDPLARLEVWQHLLLGNFAFALAFLATDPSPAPLLRGTRWLYGGLFGALTVIIRVLDPAHPEGSLFALLLAGLSVPLMDHLALRRYRVVGSGV